MCLLLSDAYMPAVNCTASVGSFRVFWLGQSQEPKTGVFGIHDCSLAAVHLACKCGCWVGSV